jgi:hypothetical protein
MRVWIDGDGSIAIGTIGYLIERVAAGTRLWSFHDRPVMGGRVGRVVALGKGRRSTRVQIQELHRKERDAFLREDGHPELIPGRPRTAVPA